MFFRQAIMGELRTGRLNRLGFILTTGLLAVLGFVAVVAVQTFGGGGVFDLRNRFPAVGLTWDTMAVLGGGLVLALWAFAIVVAVAKRFRDLGMPGWFMAFVATVMVGLAPTAVTLWDTGLLAAALWVALASVPSGAFDLSGGSSHLR
ncbi:MAG: hypothetical protein AAFO75_00200 [Pseudomonadota bacterium]